MKFPKAKHFITQEAVTELTWHSNVFSSWLEKM
jgi:hypothetical protein